MKTQHETATHDHNSYPSIEGNFFQSKELHGIMKQIGWNAFALDFPKKGGRVLTAYTPESVSLYSKLFPRFEIFYGPALGKNFSPEILDSLMKSACETAKKRGGIYLFVRTPFSFPRGYEIFAKNGFNRQLSGGEYSVLIDLEKDQDTLWRGVKRFARRCVKEALQKGVEVKGIETEEELRQFYNLYFDTGRRRGFYPLSFKLFEALWSRLEPKGMVKLFMAWRKERPIGGILNTFYGEESVPWFACSLDEFWKFHPNHLLFWHSIRWSKEAAGSSIFKLYHVPQKGERIKGVDHYTFKTCFGGSMVEECTLYEKILSPNRFRIMNILERVSRPAVQKLLLSARAQ